MSKIQKTQSSEIPVHEDQTVLEFTSDPQLSQRVDGKLYPNGINYGNSFLNEQLQKRLKAYADGTIGRSSGGQLDVTTHVDDQQLTQAYLDMQTVKVNQAIDDGIDESDDPNSDKMDEWTELSAYGSDALSPEKQQQLDARFASTFPDVEGGGVLTNQQKVQMLWSDRLSGDLTEAEVEQLTEVAKAQHLKEEDIAYLLDEVENGHTAVVFDDYKVGTTTAYDILGGGKTQDGAMLNGDQAKALQQPDPE